MMRHAIAGLLLLPLLLLACASDTPAELGAWGVGDAPGCDPGSEACWPEADRAALGRALAALRQAVDGPTSRRREAVRRVLREVRPLHRRMNDEERGTLEAASLALESPAAPPSEALLSGLVEQLERDALGRLQRAMLQAEMVPLGRSIQTLVDGAPCREGSRACAFEAETPWLPVPGSYPEGIREALRQIADTGLYGQAMVAALISTGVLDTDYPTENARLFDEWDEHEQRVVPGPLSLDARVERIVAHARSQATWAGGVTSLEALVPVAGIWVSIGHEEWWLFSIHIEMMLRIAEVYGWDMTEPATVLCALSIIMQDGTLPDGADIMISTVSIPSILRQARNRFGIWTAARVSAYYTALTGRWVYRILTRRAATELTRQVVESGAKAVTKQIFGWLTGGIFVAVGAVWDRTLTDMLGDRAAVTAWRWLGDLPRLGSTFVGQAPARACAFNVYARMAVADGRLDDREAQLYQAFMASPYWTSETQSWVADDWEQIDDAITLRWALDEGGLAACEEELFAAASAEDRLTLSALVFAMEAIDGEEGPEEQVLLDELRARLHGSWFDHLDEAELDQVQRTIRAEVALAETEIGIDNGLTLEDVVPAFDVPESTREAFLTGFGVR